MAQRQVPDVAQFARSAATSRRGGQSERLPVPLYAGPRARRSRLRVRRSGVHQHILPVRQLFGGHHLSHELWPQVLYSLDFIKQHSLYHINRTHRAELNRTLCIYNVHIISVIGILAQMGSDCAAVTPRAQGNCSTLRWPRVLGAI